MEIDTNVQNFSKDLREALLEAEDLIDRLNHGDAWAALCRDRRQTERPPTLDVYFCRHQEPSQDDDDNSAVCTAGSLPSPKRMRYDHFASLDVRAKKQCIQACLQAQGK